MATRTMIDRLSQRIDDLAEELGLAVRPVYRVWLDFGESDEEFLARYPDARGPDGRRRKPTVLLDLEDPRDGSAFRAGESVKVA
jgi:hypothetical protein